MIYRSLAVVGTACLLAACAGPDYVRQDGEWVLWKSSRASLIEPTMRPGPQHLEDRFEALAQAP